MPIVRSALVLALLRGVSVTLLAFTAPAFAGVNTWTFTGPEGGAAYAVAVHPVTAGVVFMTSGNSVFRSTDLGQSWTAVYTNQLTNVGRIVIDPTNPSRVLVADPANVLLHRSDDGGLSFALATAPGAIAKFAVAGGTLYAGGSQAKVYRSSTFGAQWEERSQGLPTTDNLLDLVVDPQNAGTVYALVESKGLYKTVDGGGLWTLVNPLSGLNARKLAVDPDPAHSNEMLLATVQGLLSSVDAGVHWTVEAPDIFPWVGYQPTTAGAAIAVPYFASVLHRPGRGQPWAAVQNLRPPTVDDGAFDPRDTDPAKGTLVLGTALGALVTRDGGATFTVGAQGVRTGEPAALATAYDGTMYASYRAGPVGVYRRTPSGWAEVDNVELKARVLNALQPLALATDPRNSNTLFVGSGLSLVRSLDGGQTWENPHPVFTVNGILPRTVAVDPANSQIVYVGTTDHGVYRTADGGTTWPTTALAPPTGVGAIAVDARNAGTVYAAVENPSAPPLLLKTTNGGTSWAPADTGLNVQQIVSVAIDPSSSQIVYAGGGGTGQGTFKSTNGGQSWTRVGAPAGDDPAFSIAIDPVVPTTIFMTMNVNGGPSRSVDGGATWEALPGARLVRVLALDPAKPSNLVAGAGSGGLVEMEIAPDLVTTIPSSPATLGLGTGGTAALRVANRGPFAASAVKLAIDVPAGVTAPAATPTQGTCTQTGAAIDCSLGAIRVNQQVDVALTLTGGAAPAAGVLTATATAHESDPVASNNAATASIAVIRISDLAATLTSSAATVDHHAPVTLTAVALNTGPNASTGTQLTVALGTAFAFQGATPSQGTCSQASGTVTCDLGSIASAAQANVAVSVLASGTGVLAPSAAVSSSATDPNPANNSATASLTSRPIANVGVRITDSADPAVSGQAFQYTVTVTNSGPDDLSNGTATITLAGSTASSATPTQGTCTVAGASVSCPLGAVPKDGTVTIAINATPSAPGRIVGTANVLHNATDPDAANDQASESTDVNAPPTVGGGGGGGGGGAAGMLELVMLLALRLLGGSARRNPSFKLRPTCLATAGTPSV